MAVNITGRQISNQHSVKHIFAILEELALEPNIIHLDLEITESALEKTEHTISIINELRQFGVMSPYGFAAIATSKTCKES
jgi:EAL domain-containing protein (putative c-di-GMP-specific phosphodiesterase class I)